MALNLTAAAVARIKPASSRRERCGTVVVSMVPLVSLPSAAFRQCLSRTPIRLLQTRW